MYDLSYFDILSDFMILSAELQALFHIDQVLLFKVSSRSTQENDRLVHFISKKSELGILADHVSAI